MIHDATVEVTCDGERCRDSVHIRPEFVYRTHNESSGYYDTSDKAIEKKLRYEDWSVVDGKHLCESCAEALEEKC